MAKKSKPKDESPTQEDLLKSLGREGELVDESDDEEGVGTPLEPLVLETDPNSGARFYRSSESMDDETGEEEGGDRVYLAEFMGCALKDLVGSMEYPLYSLSHTADKNELQKRFEYKGITIELSTGHHGLPTMNDKGVMIFIVSQLMEIKKEKGKPSRNISFKVSDIINFCSRSGCGKGYQALLLSLKRLQSTTMTTNIPWTKSADKTDTVQGQSLLGEYKLKRYQDDRKRRLDSVEIKISTWLYKAVMDNNVLTLSPRYFELSPHEQRIYELARKHAGRKREFAFKFDTLFLKSGCENTKTKYRYQVKKIAKKNTMPDYSIRMEKRIDRKTGKPTDYLVFTNRGTLDGKAAAITIPSLMPSTVENVKGIFPALTTDDLYDLVGAYARRKASKKEKIENIDAEIFPFLIKDGEAVLKQIKTERKQHLN